MTITEKSTNAAELLEKANAAFPKFKEHVESLEKGTAGALFFKGGTIKQNVRSSQTVTLKVGEREFGKAVLYGLKKEGTIDVKTWSPA